MTKNIEFTELIQKIQNKITTEQLQQQNPWEGTESNCQCFHIIIFKMSSFQQKITRHAKKQERIACTQGGKQSIETVPDLGITTQRL